MLKKKTISCNYIELLTELVEQIRKYQGVSGSAQSLFGIEDDFIEHIKGDSINLTKKPNYILVTGRTHDYNFEIHKFENILEIEKSSKDCDINIIRFVDSDSNVHTNSTITNYKVNNHPFLKTNYIRSKGNANLLCDCDGNLIYEEQLWQTYESLADNESFKPYVSHQILQSINNEFVLGKNYKCYYDESIKPDIRYSKYVIRDVSDSKKVIDACGNIDEGTYYKLLEDSSSLKKEKNRKTKQKLKDRIFK